MLMLLLLLPAPARPLIMGTRPPYNGHLPPLYWAPAPLYNAYWAIAPLYSGRMTPPYIGHLTPHNGHGGAMLMLLLRARARGYTPVCSPRPPPLWA